MYNYLIEFFIHHRVKSHLIIGKLEKNKEIKEKNKLLKTLNGRSCCLLIKRLRNYFRSAVCELQQLHTVEKVNLRLSAF